MGGDGGKLEILLIRPWIYRTARIRTSFRAAGLAVRLTRIDFEAALHAALTRTRFDAAIYDPVTTGLSIDTVIGALRDHQQSAPLIVLLSEDDVGRELHDMLATLRN